MHGDDRVTQLDRRPRQVHKAYTELAGDRATHGETAFDDAIERDLGSCFSLVVSLRSDNLRRQVAVTSVRTESVMVAVIAAVIGTLVAAPPPVGISFGISGQPVIGSRE